MGGSSVMLFGSFQYGEITVPSQNAYNQTEHLSWGDVAVDNQKSSKKLRVRLRTGAHVYVGRTACVLCPVAGVLQQM